MTDETPANSHIDNPYSGNVRVDSSCLLYSTALIPLWSRLTKNLVQSVFLFNRKHVCRQQQDTYSGKLSLNRTQPIDTSTHIQTTTWKTTTWQMYKSVQMSQRMWCIMVKYKGHRALCYRALLLASVNMTTLSQHHRHATRYAGVLAPVCYLPRATTDMRL